MGAPVALVGLGRRAHGPAGVRVEGAEFAATLTSPARTPEVPMPSVSSEPNTSASRPRSPPEHPSS
ncbi:hypothetical protein SALBM311S_06524 [Streptomyces alboniger]